MKEYIQITTVLRTTECPKCGSTFLFFIRIVDEKKNEIVDPSNLSIECPSCQEYQLSLEVPK